jgi:hypothetical protein
MLMTWKYLGPDGFMVLRATLNEQEMAGINGTGGLKKEARAGLFR